MANHKFLLAALAVPFVTFGGNALAGELELSLYGGFNSAAHSGFTATKGGNTDTGVIGWDGDSFAMPPYWGTRATYWLESASGWGFSFDYSHSKLYGDLEDAEVTGKFTTLEFTDGVNTFTANALYRHELPDTGIDLYAGVGFGFLLPHVEITTTGLANIGATDTYEYQFAGTTLQLQAGASYEFAQDWKIFGEAKINYAMINAALNGGGSFETNVVISQLILGLSYTLGDY